MKLYVVKSGTECLVVKDVMAEDATLDLHVTRATFEDHAYVMAPGHGVADSANRCVRRGWNDRVVKGLVGFADNGHFVFTKKNRNGDTSLLVVHNNFVEVIC